MFSIHIRLGSNNIECLYNSQKPVVKHKSCTKVFYKTQVLYDWCLVLIGYTDISNYNNIANCDLHYIWPRYTINSYNILLCYTVLFECTSL